MSLPITGNDFNTDMQALGFTHMTVGAQLSVDQDGFVTFTYIGAESGFTDSFNTPSDSMTEANEPFNFSGYDSITANVTAGEILNFNFTAPGSGLGPVDNFSGTNLLGMGIFTRGSGWPHQQVILGFDDLWKWSSSDDNHDDMMIRVDYNPVPIPPAILLLGSGLLGLAGIRKKFKR